MHLALNARVMDVSLPRGAARAVNVASGGSAALCPCGCRVDATKLRRRTAQTSAVLSARRLWHSAVMAHPRKSNHHRATMLGAVPDGVHKSARPAGLIDPRAFGLVKAAYSVREALELLSIGRTSLYAAIRRGDLKRVKVGRRTLFCATDLAAFLTRLQATAN